MTGANGKARRIRLCALSVALSMALAPVDTLLQRLSAQDQKGLGTINPSRRMADGRLWATHNLNVETAQSYCYENSKENCRRYGRLYAWESARRGCQLLGEGWRLPTVDEWRQMAKHYGGIHDDSGDGGKAAYKELLIGGDSGFDAMLGGGRDLDGKYARLEAHGFYWTASENDPANAMFYNFARGQLSLFLQNGGEKQRAFSVRCVKN